MSYIVPIGPYHPALEEPIHARLTVDGEKISDVLGSYTGMDKDGSRPVQDADDL